MSESEPGSQAQPPGGQRLTWLAMLTRALIAGGVVVGALVVFVLLFVLKASPPKHEQEGPTLLVRTLVVEQINVPRVWEGFGTARAMASADVPAQVAGRVVKRHKRIEEGAAVQAGDLIVRIDPTDYDQRLLASLKRGEALEADLSALEVEEANLRRQVELAQQEEQTASRDYDRAIEADRAGAGSPSEIDLRLGALRRAQRTLETLRQQLGVVPARRSRLVAQLAGELATRRIEQENVARTSVTSPIDGVLQLVGVEVGEWVSVSQTVARVVDLRRIEIPLRLAMSAQGSVSVGDRVELRPDGPAQSVWTGRVARIAPEGDRATRTLGVFVELTQDPENADGAPILTPGRFVVGRVLTLREHPRVLVPRRAIDEDRVMIAVDEGDVGVRRVRALDVRVEHYYSGAIPGQSPSEREWAVLEPAGSIDPGSSVILTNLDQLVQDMSVGVRPDEGADSGLVRDGAGTGPEPAAGGG